MYRKQFDTTLDFASPVSIDGLPGITDTVVNEFSRSGSESTRPSQLLGARKTRLLEDNARCFQSLGVSGPQRSRYSKRPPRRTFRFNVFVPHFPVRYAAESPRARFRSATRTFSFFYVQILVYAGNAFYANDTSRRLFPPECHGTAADIPWSCLKVRRNVSKPYSVYN